jgi:hypothetical protein
MKSCGKTADPVEKRACGNHNRPIELKKCKNVIFLGEQK